MERVSTINSIGSTYGAYLSGMDRLQARFESDAADVVETTTQINNTAAELDDSDTETEASGDVSWTTSTGDTVTISAETADLILSGEDTDLSRALVQMRASSGGTQAIMAMAGRAGDLVSEFIDGLKSDDE